MKTLLKIFLFIILFPVVAPLVLIVGGTLVYTMATLAAFVFIVMMGLLLG